MTKRTDRNANAQSACSPGLGEVVEVATLLALLLGGAVLLVKFVDFGLDALAKQPF